MKRLDKETSDIIRSEKQIEELLRHEGWVIVKDVFDKKILDLESILHIDTKMKAEQIAVDVKARTIAMKILMDWMIEIVGMAENSKITDQISKRESLIYRQ